MREKDNAKCPSGSRPGYVRQIDRHMVGVNRKKNALPPFTLNADSPMVLTFPMFFHPLPRGYHSPFPPRSRQDRNYYTVVTVHLVWTTHNKIMQSMRNSSCAEILLHVRWPTIHFFLPFFGFSSYTPAELIGAGSNMPAEGGCKSLELPE